MKKGWIKVHREILDHWVFQDERHFRRWMIILLNVNHTETKFPVGDSLFICRPGESFISIDHWATMFNCSKPSVGKFFKLLENEGMLQRKIIGKGNRRKHLLTVMNWAKYQGDETGIYPERKPEYTPNGNPNIPPNKNDIEFFNNDKNEKNVFLSEKNFSDVFNDWKIHFELTTKKRLTDVIIKNQSDDLNIKSNGDITTATEIIKRAIRSGKTTFIPMISIKEKVNSKDFYNGELAGSTEHATDTIG
jgi:hypothetical protein